MLKAVNLTKTYGSRLVLRGLSITIEPGEIVSLVGINGAGKSTLLRILADLTQADLGQVQLGNTSLRIDPSEYRRRIGVVLHAPMLYGSLSARENLRFFSRLHQINDPHEHIEELLQTVNLRSRADDLVRTFSRGMQQRLSIARALLHDPACLLLDEPYTGLDPDSSSVFESLIRRAAADQKMVLLATHDLDKAARSSTRIDLLHQGKIAHTQSTGDVTPENLAKLYRQITGSQPVKPVEGDAA